MRILSVEATRQLEAEADAAGHRYAAMMEQAGAGVALAIRRHHPVEGQRVLVLVGPGDNGGDGLVAARILQRDGAKVVAYLTRARDASQDAVYEAALDQDVDIYVAEDDFDEKALQALVCQADIVVDALLGTGASPPLRGTVAAVVERVSACFAERTALALTYASRGSLSRRPNPTVIAVDGPSGLNFDTGEIDDRALKAALTVTFAYPKWGHLRLPGAAWVGELVVAAIGIPEDVTPKPGPGLVTPEWVRSLLPDRPVDAHKGTFGKALIVAGSANYTGAAVLAASAAIRTGAGLVTLAIPSELHSAVVPAVPEATYLLLPHALGVVNAHAVAVLDENAAGYSALLIGPGLGNVPESQEFLIELLTGSDRQRRAGFVRDAVLTSSGRQLPPLIVDADGLNVLAGHPSWPTTLPPDTVLTPHPGEMARLTGLSVEEIQADRVGVAQHWAETWQQVVVLKGAFTVIAAPDRTPALLPFANPGLASAGTGDVLAGTIVALRAQGLGGFEAALAGAYVHGLAGGIATERYGAAAVAASDVVAHMGEALQRLSGVA